MNAEQTMSEHTKETLVETIARLTAELEQAQSERDGANEGYEKVKQANRDYIFSIRAMLRMKTPGDGFVESLKAMKDERDSLKTELAQAREERDRLNHRVYMLGTWKCDKCNFEQNTRIINPAMGTIGVPTLEEIQVCPNDGETMRRVTWEECAASNYEAATRFLNEREEAWKERDTLRAETERLANELAAEKEHHRMFVQESMPDEAIRELVRDRDAAHERADQLESELSAVRLCFSEASHLAGPTTVHVAMLKARVAELETMVKTAFVEGRRTNKPFIISDEELNFDWKYSKVEKALNAK